MDGVSGAPRRRGPATLVGADRARVCRRRPCPFSVPLEVGYTLPSRTFAHLLTEGAVARWPYDEDQIHLLVDQRAGLHMGTRPLPADVQPMRVL